MFIAAKTTNLPRLCDEESLICLALKPPLTGEGKGNKQQVY